MSSASGKPPERKKGLFVVLLNAIAKAPEAESFQLSGSSAPEHEESERARFFRYRH
jgi:hypothetical protein